eukprot:scaffold20574_cov34-Tisochrysis_lutea.AAC.4
MDTHAVPSGGDWALDRNGAIFFQGTERVTVRNCSFERLDGNGVMISGYNRHIEISHSDFAYLGGNAIASWGYTNETSTDPGRPGIVLANAPSAGVDGTDGEHPRHTTVTGCVAREIGLYEKQSSFYVQAKTAEARVVGNVFFNGPRAGINFNDGFGGGDEIARNLVFSTCRESGDHGEKFGRCDSRGGSVQREARIHPTHPCFGLRPLEFVGQAAVPHHSTRRHSVDDHGVASYPPQLFH